MNIVNIDKAIAVMQRAKSLNMQYWQMQPGISSMEIPQRVDSIAELHECGNTACFAGYIAISPEFKKDGGVRSNDGAPQLPGFDHGADTIGNWLGISEVTTELFIFGNTRHTRDEHDNHVNSSRFYDNKPWSSVTPQDVIAKLTELKEIGEEAFTAAYVR